MSEASLALGPQLGTGANKGATRRHPFPGDLAQQPADVVACRAQHRVQAIALCFFQVTAVWASPGFPDTSNDMICSVTSPPYPVISKLEWGCSSLATTNRDARGWVRLAIRSVLMASMLA